MYQKEIVVRTSVVVGTGMVMFAMIACNGLPVTTPGPAAGPQTYMAATVASASHSASESLSRYTIDDAANTYSQTTTLFSGHQQFTEANSAGTFSVLPRGLRELTATYSLPYAGLTDVPSTTPVTSNYAVELADQAGGLVQLFGSAATPMVATASCPSYATSQTFLFVSLPGALTDAGTEVQNNWNPALETAYGSVSIGTSSTTVNLSNIQQSSLPGSAGPPPTYAATAAGTCSQTPYGYAISIPSDTLVTNPGSGQSTGAGAVLGIGPSGLLVESALPGTNLLNTLGAGTGAIGLPQPASALGTSPVAAGTSATAPEYLGFIYGTGNTSAAAATTGWSSNVASFGFPSNLQSSSCASFAAQTGSLVNGIYGGDFPQNASGLPDPTLGSQGYGNCDLAVDLGSESSSGHGLYPAATVWIGSQFFANSTATKNTYSFPAVAIAGQLNGKYAIFVIGLDTTSSPSQAWTLYLMQSN